MLGRQKKIVAAGILIPLLLIGVVILYNYVTSFASITVSSSVEGKIQLYEAGFMDGASYKADVPPVMLTQNEPLRIKKGGYIVEYKKDGYTTIEQPVELDDDQSIQLQPVKSVANLDDLLRQEKDTIYKAITAKYPDIFTLYDVDYESLYGNGEWYGVRLSYKDDASLQRDSLRVVLKKEGTWKIYAKPYLTLSKAEYPAAPTYMLEDLNKPTKADDRRYTGNTAPVSGYQTE